jgi:AraC-like DNA-binding protein
MVFSLSVDDRSTVGGVYDAGVTARNDRRSGSLASSSADRPEPARASALPAPESGAEGSTGVDALSDVLRAVRLSAAVFFRVEARSPWVIGVPDGATIARSVVPRAQHVISYHVVTDGRCWGGVPGESPMALAPGDVLVLPHGDPYVMSLSSDLRGGPEQAEVLGFLGAMAAGRLPFTVTEDGGGAERLQLVCGFLGCDVRPFNPLLAFTIAESRDRRAGGECVRLRLGELMFIEVVRRHLAALPPEQRGWLAGLRDPMVGRALALLHERPAHPWTLEELARESGASRSVLAERFTLFVHDPPMQYLTRWRMQIAARLLAESTSKVSAVALEVGYDSEAAFSRAFKKAAGVPPATWRQRHAARPAGMF